jgi:hypothetical protein
LRDHLRFWHVVTRIDALTHYYALVTMLRCRRGTIENADW